MKTGTIEERLFLALSRAPLPPHPAASEQEWYGWLKRYREWFDQIRTPAIQSDW